MKESFPTRWERRICVKDDRRVEVVVPWSASVRVKLLVEDDVEEGWLLLAVLDSREACQKLLEELFAIWLALVDDTTVRDRLR